MTTKRDLPPQVRERTVSKARTLIEALQAVGRYGGRLRLFGLSPAVKNLFKLSNLISIFDLRESREDATRK